ncbi:hypothetical protein [Vibrio sp. SCSIO 43155]|nr:hypothetical protein [Vibrio sp. SCSIO 43155]USD58456.1 hypothetical protein J4N44_27570 [Vibrio sp. SCSIO 43155]
MFVQIGVWGSKRLARYLMERNNPNHWLFDVDDDTKRSIEKLHPVSIKSDFQEQHGSIMPKLLRYYDIPQGSNLAKKSRLDLSPYRARMDHKLTPYMDESIGVDCRFSDQDDIQVYPCLNHESSDYFTTHNIYSEYACEDFLRLIHRQLRNYCSSECYMTQIRAYDPNFDTCYQSIHVKNPYALKDKVSDEPVEIQQAWLGQHEYGYAVHELERELGEGALKGTSFRDPDTIISPTEMNKLILSGSVDKQIIRNIQLHHNILWNEAFDPNHVSFMYDLLGIRTKQNFYITHSKEVQFLDFDWESLA